MKSGIRVGSDEQLSHCSNAARGCGEAQPKFWSLVKPYSNRGRGADYAHHITAWPPIFENLTASLIIALFFDFVLHDYSVIQFTNEQLKLLENCFQQKSHPDKKTRKNLASKTLVSEEKVKTWFNNRRIKEKKIQESRLE